jgi:hypothetical protein
MYKQAKQLNVLEEIRSEDLDRVYFKVTVFLVVLPFSPVKVYRRFGDACYFRFQGDGTYYIT